MEVINYSQELEASSRSFKERGDCTVLAWANVFDCSYEKAHAHMRKFGRKNKRGMLIHQIESAIFSCKKAKVRKGPYSRDNKITLKKFCDQHSEGRYYVLVRGHALCVKDGVIHDYKAGLRRQVHCAFRIYLEGEV